MKVTHNMVVTKRIEFNNETVESMTCECLAEAARKVFGEPGPGEEVKVTYSKWGTSVAEIVPIQLQPSAETMAQSQTLADDKPF